MEAREDIPRVSVDSVQDWRTVKTHYREAAMEELQKLLAGQDVGREKDAIVMHLEQFINKTFSLAEPNLRVNGHHFESLDKDGREMELFDETLDRRIWSLADTRLQWHKRIADTRRTVPREIEKTLSSLLEQHKELDSTLLPELSNDVDDQDSTLLDEASGQRLGEVAQRTTGLVNELDQTVTEQQERGMRSEVIANEVKSLKP
ncbi:hypothetical protein D9619_005648 [Psilocybe cf. subviscida]|uniref:Uncharacterized protein n=1 Tax=Psilocybe cf. subviscida TaxID=2480587 RepID=A0A8H5BW43_9AGAR|nr:hypothetical protein D9619_005648 [Psilocybe cf. subviscida]